MKARSWTYHGRPLISVDPLPGMLSATVIMFATLSSTTLHQPAVTLSLATSTQDPQAAVPAIHRIR